jgi:hypothetical protein
MPIDGRVNLTIFSSAEVKYITTIRTILILIENVKEGKMVPVRYGQQLLRNIRFFPSVIRSYPDVRDCKEYNQSRQHMKQKKVPESIATIVRISRLQLNSGLTMSAFDICTFTVSSMNCTRNRLEIHLGI